MRASLPIFWGCLSNCRIERGSLEKVCIKDQTDNLSSIERREISTLRRVSAKDECSVV